MNDQIDAAGRGGAEGAWIQRVAALPLDGPPLPDPQVLWWKAQALRRFDAAARPDAAADHIQTGVAFVAAVALLIYLFAGGSGLLLRLPAVTLPLVLSIVLLVVGIIMIGRSMQRGFR